MSLSHGEFQILTRLLKAPGTSQRSLAQGTGVSLGSVNSALRSLREAGLVDGLSITEQGVSALNPYKVDNAVIMAAGMSTRFAPFSYEKPKGLLTVKGEVLVERTIRQLQEAGITDITLVVGYKMEQFLYLEDTMGVSIVINSEYAERNNNSSLKAVEDRLKNTYICSSDNYFTENVFSSHVDHAYYAAVWQDGPSDEWGLTVGPHGRITHVAPGSIDAWVMLGHAYFDHAFSTGFVAALDRVYDDPQTRPKLWEAIYAENINELDMRIREYPAGIIHEFDSLNELKRFDPDFILNVDSSILDNICSTLDVSRSSLDGFIPIEEGLTNLSFRFTVSHDNEPENTAQSRSAYVYRHPGIATQGLLDRRAEAAAETVAKDLGLDDSFIHIDPDTGWKISSWVDVTEPFDYHNPEHVARSMVLIRKLHASGVTVDATFDIFTKAHGWAEKLESVGALSFPEFPVLTSQARRLYDLTQADKVQPVLCHNDFYETNILVAGKSMVLIDWEYAGMSDYASDIGVFICCSDYTWEDSVAAIRAYFGREPSDEEFRHCVAYIALTAYHWWLWALWMDHCGESVGKYTHLYYRFTKTYSERAIELYSK